MTQSKPNIFRLTLIRLWVLFTLFLISGLLVELTTNLLGLNGLAIYCIVIAILVGIIGTLVALPEVNSLTIDDDKIIVRNIFTRKSIDFPFETIDEFKILINFQRYRGFQFELILLNRSNSYEPISLNCIYNINDIITALEKKLVNSTKDEYGILELIKNRQSR